MLPPSSTSSLAPRGRRALASPLRAARQRRHATRTGQPHRRRRSRQAGVTLRAASFRRSDYYYFRRVQRRTVCGRSAATKKTNPAASAAARSVPSGRRKNGDPAARNVIRLPQLRRRAVTACPVLVTGLPTNSHARDDVAVALPHPTPASPVRRQGGSKGRIWAAPPPRRRPRACRRAEDARRIPRGTLPGRPRQHGGLLAGDLPATTTGHSFPAGPAE